LYDYHKALLFEEAHQMTLDGNKKKIANGRISFFRRLQMMAGADVAKFEDVMFFRRKDGTPK